MRSLNERAIRQEGKYVLYWMTAFRRMDWNFSLDLAVDWARELDRPLLVFEALRTDYRWASDRFHQFVLQGMRDNLHAARAADVAYFPFVEEQRGHGKGLFAALAADACLVVGDDFPSFFLPKMVAAAASRIDVPLYAVDSNGLLPLRATEKVFSRAVDFRRFLQKELPPHLETLPRERPLADDLPRLNKLPVAVTKKWPSFAERLEQEDWDLAKFPIDHMVPAIDAQGGSSEGKRIWTRFLDERLDRYGEDRNVPDRRGASELSPYLHFGFFSVHQAFHDLARREGWTPDKLAKKASGKRKRWWGMSEQAEAFLDELVTWREVGFNRSALAGQEDGIESLPDWTRKTLSDHRRDRRNPTYTLEELEQARTYDPLWNASQRQLVREGRIHNYLRMLWGKKILEWTESPEQALEYMIELNNKYALDGRNPNSYSGIFWVLGRYDRAWGPERPIFGKIRYMSSENTARKFPVREYVARYGPEDTSPG
ncbi:MAG TPA: deoxyribodipyrimidine photolyase [Pirellulaceae bacterium]|nr:deoxyribodipyrimidine photolyase [Pirellulaceae bacterium]